MRARGVWVFIYAYIYIYIFLHKWLQKYEPWHKCLCWTGGSVLDPLLCKSLVEEMRPNNIGGCSELKYSSDQGLYLFFFLTSGQALSESYSAHIGLAETRELFVVPWSVPVRVHCRSWGPLWLRGTTSNAFESLWQLSFQIIDLDWICRHWVLKTVSGLLMLVTSSCSLGRSVQLSSIRGLLVWVVMSISQC